MQNKEKNVCEMTEKELNDKSSKAKDQLGKIKEVRPDVSHLFQWVDGVLVGAEIAAFAINQKLDNPSLSKVVFGLAGGICGLSLCNVAVQGAFRYVAKKAAFDVKEVELELERRRLEQMCASKSMEDEQELNNF